MATKEGLEKWIAGKNNFSDQLPPEIEVVSHYENGGQGMVFDGRMNGERIAIKLYYPGQISIRIDREIRALKEINSDQIVPYRWSGEVCFDHVNLPVVCTKFLEGASLSKHVKQIALTEAELSHLLCDVAVAIDTMWKKRIVHRDLKPANIIRLLSGRFCIIDLGLARHIDMVSLTPLGATGGTPGYLSPEQARAVRQLTCKSDIYALGVLAIQAVLQRHPTMGDQFALQRAGLHKQLPPAMEQFAIAPLVKKMLDPSPLRRPNPSSVINELCN